MTNKIYIYKPSRDYMDINAWRKQESFPIYSLNLPQLKRLDDFDIIEVIFEGSQGNDDLYKSKVLLFNNTLERYIDSLKHKKYFFSISRVDYKNRIRSYQGHLLKLFPKEEIIEKEIEVKEGKSLFISLINIDKQNYNKINYLLYQSEQNFILSTDTYTFSEETLLYIFQKCVNISSNTINYIQVCFHLCEKNNIIIRETGDGGDEQFSWQVFINKNLKTNTLKNIENILMCSELQ